MRTTKSVTISLPPAQFKTAERLAKKQSRTMSELFREGLRRLEEEEAMPSPRALRDLGAIIRLFQQAARRTGLDKMTKREINAEITAARRDMLRRPRQARNRSGK
jgi:hypothetical protein